MMTKKLPQVMDIAKPGTLKGGSATSRPIIVTNKVIIQDPMVNAQASEEPETKSKPEKSTKVVIRPLSDPEPSADEEVDTKIAAKEGLLDIAFDTSSDAVDDPEILKPTETAPEPSKPAAKKSETTDSEVQSEPTDSDISALQKNDRDKQAVQDEEDAKANEEIAQLVDEKTYFLPIDAAQHRRSRIFAIVGMVLILVLALAWLNIALDAGLITIPGIQPVTHFFK